MNIGDLVTVKKNSPVDWMASPQSVGIVIDTLMMDDGFFEYEVMFEDWGIGWFSDLMLEAVDEEK